MSTINPMHEPIQLTPEYRDYVWGGSKLKPGSSPIAEAWMLDEHDIVTSGPLAGRTLASVTAEYKDALLGKKVVKRTGLSFPLLIKLLDCAAWLSLQVHPNDEQAKKLEGPGLFGKTEAWHVLDASSDAKLIAGLKPATSGEMLLQAIKNGKVLDIVQYVEAKKGETLFIKPGTIHALGPGYLIYEVQQTSNITYRVFDWNRPQTGGRVLHIEKSLAVADPSSGALMSGAPAQSKTGETVLCECPYFTLAMVSSQKDEISLDTRKESFHSLMVIDGSCTVCVGSSEVTLGKLESALIPAACGSYSIKTQRGYKLLKSSIE